MKSNEIAIYEYNGNPISFDKIEKGYMINATQMAKPFRKLPAGWLRSQTAKEYIDTLAAMQNCIPADLVKVVNGGDNFGTWMHEDVALEFARWLSPKFAIWCNNRIKELLLTGTTTILKLAA